MLGSKWQRRCFFALLPSLAVIAACGSTIKSQSQVSATAAAAPARSAEAPAVEEASVPAHPQPPVQDPVLGLIETADRHFKAGQTALEQGHFEAAKQEF